MNTFNIMTDSEILHYITTEDENEMEALFARARALREEHYGKGVYFRGLIEFSNYCKNNCFYCGLRLSNKKIERYRLSKDEILDCCKTGLELGYRTYVLQSGEDDFYTDDMICDIVSAIKKDFPECVLTLSLGEKVYDSYKRYFEAGVERYLLRHESANDEHYKKLHPKSMSLENRKQCLRNLKKIGYQVGAGFMVGSPYQTAENLLEDIRFLEELRPEMIGIGPFIPQSDTPFANFPAGTLAQTLRLLALVRIAVPTALLPATTALGTISPVGREKGLNAGANVVMPNLSPKSKRKLYALYDNKICTGDEAAECRFCIDRRIRSAGYLPDLGRGDNVLVAAARNASIS